jgi:hypothetical protein
MNLPQPIPPYEVTALATKIGKLLSACHNAYSSMYVDAYSGKPHEVVGSDSRQRLCDDLARFNADLRQINKLLTKTAAVFKINAEYREICNHCDQRQSLPYSPYCGFCHSWAKDHHGNLPSDAVLAVKEERRAKHTNRRYE